MSVPKPLREALTDSNEEIWRPAARAIALDSGLLEKIFAKKHPLKRSLGTAWDNSQWQKKAAQLQLYWVMVAPDPGPLVRAHAASRTSLKWTAADGELDDLDLGRFTQLTELHLEGFDLKKVQFPRCPTVFSLTMRKCEIVADLAILGAAFPALEDLKITGCPVEEFRGWAHLRKLASATLRRTPTRSLGDIAASGMTGLSLIESPLEALGKLPPTLERLSIRWSDIGELDPFSDCPKLTSLQIAGCPQLKSCSGWNPRPDLHFNCRDVGLTSLVDYPFLGNKSPYLSGFLVQSLHGIPDDVEELFFSGSALTSLHGVPTSLRKLTLHECDKLESLDGLEVCTQLHTIEVRRVPVSDLSDLRRIPNLRIVDFSYNEATQTLGELVGHPNVRAIKINDTSIARRDVPKEHRWKCTWSMRADLAELAARQPPESAPVQTPTRKQHLAAIRKLLRSKSVEMIDQGIELARALGTVEVFDSLVGKAKVVPHKDSQPYAWGNRLVCSGFSGIKGVYALTGLIGAAPLGTKAHALREGLTQLTLTAKRPDWGMADIHPKHLAALGIEKLTVSRAGPMVDAGPDWPSLREVQLYQAHVSNLDWLAGASNLEVLELISTHIDDFSGLPSLATLKLGVRASPADLVHLGLNTLSIRYGGRLDDVQDLALLTTLRSLETRYETLAPVAEMPWLRELECHEPADLAALASHPGLEKIRLRKGCENPEVLLTMPALVSVKGRIPEPIMADPAAPWNHKE